MINKLHIAPDGEVPLRGARKIAGAAYGSCEDQDVKRLYNEWQSLPVFRSKPRGPLLAYPSQLREHYAALSAQAAVRAAAKAVGAEAVKPVAQKAEAAKPKPRQRARNRRSQIAAE